MVTKIKTCSSKPRGPKYIDKTVSKSVRFKSENNIKNYIQML